MTTKVVNILFPLIGGLALFFFGMVTLSEGLRRSASDRLRNLLERSVGNPLKGLLVGTVVTGLIQSSSAMATLLVGFVNAGLIRLRHAIAIILGANIGTTLTAWIVSLIGIFALLNITQYIMPVIAVGLALSYLCRTAKLQGYGRALFGFGILLLGLSFMKDASGPLKETGIFEQWFAGASPLLAVPMGMVACWVLQSSSATIAIIQVLAFQGMMPFPVALGLALGADMGTPITAEIAAFTGNQAARRTARSHTIFNLLGPIYLIPLLCLGLWPRLVESLIPGPVTAANMMVHIALAHTIYNSFSALLFLPLIGMLETMSIWSTDLTDRIGCTLVKFITKGKRHWPRREILTATFQLEERILSLPSMAIAYTVQGMVNMLILCQEVLEYALGALFEKKSKNFPEVKQREDTIDVLQRQLTEYLTLLIQKQPDTAVAHGIPVLIHSINDIEKIGDYAEGMAKTAEHVLNDQINFGQEAIAELRTIFKETQDMTQTVIGALKENSKTLAQSALQYESRIDELRDVYRENNIQRLVKAVYSPSAGIYFSDYLTKFEKIGDHLTNIAEGILRSQSPAEQALN